MTDTLYADVSEFQCPISDAYPYRMVAIRSNDGTYQDRNFAANYAWCCAKADSGQLDCFIVYAYWRPNWADTLDTMKSMVGTPHPKMIVMIDLESGGNPGGDQSDGVNRFYWGAADWIGDRRRVIGYGNTSDLNAMWPTKPDGVRLVLAGYGSNPNYPGKIAHQYTDGTGFGGGLPEGCPPFGNCDMNSADGISASDFAAACGIGTKPQEGTVQQSDIDAITASVTASVTKWLADFIAGFNGPIGHDTKRVAAQMGLAQNDTGFGAIPGFPQGGSRSLYDLTSAIAAKLGVPNCSDTLPNGPHPGGN